MKFIIQKLKSKEEKNQIFRTIVNKLLKNVTLLNHSEYLYLKVELDAIDELQEIELEEKLRHPLYVEFCSKEKIPFRIAYEHEDFFIVSRNIEEIKLKK